MGVIESRKIQNGADINPKQLAAARELTEQEDSAAGARAAVAAMGLLRELKAGRLAESRAEGTGPETVVQDGSLEKLNVE